MIRKALLVLAVLTLLLPAVSRGDPIKFGGHGGIHLGGIYINPSGLNRFLNPAGVEDIPSLLPIIGGGGQAILFKGVVIGAQGSVFQRHLSGESMSVNASSSFGFMDIGYAVLNTDRWILVPLAGVGGFSARLEMDGDISSVGLEKFAKDYDPDNPGRVVNDKVLLATSSAVGHLGVSAYHVVRFAEGEGGGFGAFLVGLSTGWIFEMTHSGWEIEGRNVRNEPTWKPDSAFLQLEIHFGGGTTGHEKESCPATPAGRPAESKDEPKAGRPTGPDSREISDEGAS